MNVYENGKRKIKYRRRAESLSDPVRRTIVMEHTTDEAIISAGIQWDMSYAAVVERIVRAYLNVTS